MLEGESFVNRTANTSSVWRKAGLNSHSASTTRVPARIRSYPPQKFSAAAPFSPRGTARFRPPATAVARRSIRQHSTWTRLHTPAPPLHYRYATLRAESRGVAESECGRKWRTCHSNSAGGIRQRALVGLGIIRRARPVTRSNFLSLLNTVRPRSYILNYHGAILFFRAKFSSLLDCLTCISYL